MAVLSPSVPAIISASRRSDIPAFFGDWFLNSVHQGFAEVVHPFTHQKQQVSLHPEKVAAIVFWSKNYAPFMPLLHAIEDIYQRRFLFHFTINGLEGDAKSILEPRVPDTAMAIDTVQKLAERYGPETVLWRFDPIVFTNLTPPAEREAAFERLACALNHKVRRCYISFIDLYGKVLRRLQKPEVAARLQLQKPHTTEMLTFVERLKIIASNNDIQLFTCCENWLAGATGIARGHCIDALLLQFLYPETKFNTKLNPTRPECGCYASIDIGTYNTCHHRCLYCYANF